MGKKRRQKRSRPSTEGDRREPGVDGREHESTSRERRPYRRRRQFSPEYKLALVLAAESLTERGQVAELLRREDVQRNQLSKWRKEVREGTLGPSTAEQNRMRNPSAEVEMRRLRRENERLEAKLRQAELIIQLQKKASEILGIDLPRDDDDF